MNRKTQTLTVNFRIPNVSFSAEELEEGDYENSPVYTVDKITATADKKSPFFTRSFPTLAVSWLMLFVIVALQIYFTSVISENNAKLTAEKMNLEKQNQELEKQNQELETQNQELETQNQELETQNQELEMEKRNLANQINDMAKGNELNISRAQWSIDAYCPKRDARRQCKSCQPGRILFQSSCYMVLDYKTSTDRKTWKEARELCKIRSSDLVVVDNAEEKTYVHVNSYNRPGNEGYWIGLKVEDGKWKWVNGSDLADSSWIENPTDGHCAISVTNDGWKSVNCTNRNRWICEQKSLSV
ncbi:C-type lectin domain family 10 member A-like isoform X2 [Embiotoca jacksoni]|uniref:C-type lectin domain family 10 member A-like isoform X2 n=1 Tax=Embiotoca jacksoni TaxID=100190 RepID=UPI003704AFF4